MNYLLKDDPFFRKSIFVDVDGTLTVETEGWGRETYRNRTPNLESIEKINNLYDAGHEITIWTARYDVDCAVTTEWLRIHKVKYHHLILDKEEFDVYICDKVVNIKDL